MPLALDHLIVAAATLDEGVAWCRANFGFQPEAGGLHPLMGTHNRVFSIASAGWERSFFEIIAIDPKAAAPQRRRWFDLDDAALQSALRVNGPQLVHWVARCPNLLLASADWLRSGVDIGPVVAVERATPQGLLRWQLSVRDDGRRLSDGACPTLIEWGAVHPCDALPPSGVRLQHLALEGLPASLRPWLPDGIECVAGLGVPVRAPIRATLSTPRGTLTLSSIALG